VARYSPLATQSNSDEGAKRPPDLREGSRVAERIARHVVLGVALTFGLMGGCAFRPGSTDVGTIQVGDRGLAIEKIDGRPIPAPKRQPRTESLLVDAGRHVFEVSYSRLTGPDPTWTATGSVELTVKAHKAYVVKSAAVGTGIIFWVEDAHNGKVVAGTRPRMP
jgi:hypothetical protein